MAWKLHVAEEKSIRRASAAAPAPDYFRDSCRPCPSPGICHYGRLALSLFHAPLNSPKQVVRCLSCPGNAPDTGVHYDTIVAVSCVCFGRCCAQLCLEIDAATKTTVECRLQMLHLFPVLAQLLFNGCHICINLFN